MLFYLLIFPKCKTIPSASLIKLIKRLLKGAFYQLNPDANIQKTKMKTIWGCLSSFILVIVMPILLIFGYFYYQMNLKEQTLLVSHSPDQETVFEIIEKGQPFLFGHSNVRINYHNQMIERSIFNDGAVLDSDNFDVEWTSNDAATIYLDGDEQSLDVIHFDRTQPEVFRQEQVELEAIKLETSLSPDQTKMIEVKEITLSKGSKFPKLLRFYYGDTGSELADYEEIEKYFRFDSYRIDWIDNNDVSVSLLSSENEVLESLDIYID